MFEIYAGRMEGIQNRFFQRVYFQFASLFLSLQFVRAIGKEQSCMQMIGRLIVDTRLSRHTKEMLEFCLLFLIFLLKIYTLSHILLSRSVIKNKLELFSYILYNIENGI